MAPRSALVWLNRMLNRIKNVDLSIYNSSALSQFTTDMPAVAKAVLDAFDGQLLRREYVLHLQHHYSWRFPACDRSDWLPR